MFDVEEIYNLLLKLSQETDPLKAEEIADEIRYNCQSGYGSWHISLPDNLYNVDFFNVCKRHKEIYENLKKDGLLDSFLNMKEELRSHLIRDIEQLIPIDIDSVHLFSFTYDPTSLIITSFNSKLIDLQEYLRNHCEPGAKYSEGIITYSNGKIEYSWRPGAHLKIEKYDGNVIDWYRSKNFWLYYRCLDVVFSLRYCEEIDI
jgi:hypothetical protein